MKLLGLLGVALGKGLLCKALALGLLLAFFYVKGRRSGLDDRGWEDWFRGLLPGQISWAVGALVLAAGGGSSAAAYGLLRLLGYQYAAGIALALFLLGGAYSAWRWTRGGREAVLRRMRQRDLKE